MVEYIKVFKRRQVLKHAIFLIPAISNGVFFHLIAYIKSLKYAIKQRNYAVNLYASEHSDLYRGLQLYLLFSISEAEHESNRGSHWGQHFQKVAGRLSHLASSSSSFSSPIKNSLGPFKTVFRKWWPPASFDLNSSGG